MPLTLVAHSAGGCSRIKSENAVPVSSEMKGRAPIVDGSHSIAVLGKDQIDHVTVCDGLDTGDGHLPLLVIHEIVQCTHRPAGAANVSVGRAELFACRSFEGLQCR